jgi:hypothetical protein
MVEEVAGADPTLRARIFISRNEMTTLYTAGAAAAAVAASELIVAAGT